MAAVAVTKKPRQRGLPDWVSARCRGEESCLSETLALNYPAIFVAHPEAV